MISRILPHLLLALPLFAAGAAHAEKADSDKPIDIECDNSVNDDVKLVRTCTGNVILTQGTLIMKGAKLVVKETPDGWSFSTLYAPPGGLATMRQKRDGGPDLWMEGEAADRITYDQKTGVASMYDKAKTRRLDGKQKTDEATGPFLSYNSQTEIVTGAMSADGSKGNGVDRPHIEIQPHHPPAGASAQSSTQADQKGK
ncbi:MAG TPA: lipopolysaccharide transport periplasmic protein LptA [Burkholderiaceae bacterium]